MRLLVLLAALICPVSTWSEDHVISGFWRYQDGLIQHCIRLDIDVVLCSSLTREIFIELMAGAGIES